MKQYSLKVLGLSVLAALGLMAFAAVGAQAGEVLVLGKQATVGQEISGSQEGEGKLLVPALKLEIRCANFDVLEGKITKSGTEAEGKGAILYLGCTAWGLNAEKTALIELTSCHLLDNSGTEKDITAKAILKIDLKEGSTLIVASPEVAGTNFAKIKFTAGLGCTLTTPIEIKGEAGFKVITGNLQGGGAAVVEPLVESSEAIQKSKGLVLKYGANESFIDGSGKLVLKGTNVGCTWGAL